MPEVMFSFAQWCKSQDGLSSPLSLRDLVSWAGFIVAMQQNKSVVNSVNSGGGGGSGSGSGGGISDYDSHLGAWVHFAHGACLAILDGIGMLSNSGMQEDEIVEKRSQAVAALLTALEDSDVAVRALLLF